METVSISDISSINKKLMEIYKEDSAPKPDEYTHDQIMMGLHIMSTEFKSLYKYATVEKNWFEKFMSIVLPVEFNYVDFKKVALFNNIKI